MGRKLKPSDLSIVSRIQKPDGYVYLRVPGHPRAMKLGYVYEHRFIVELSLGRFLSKGEVVHHKNHIRGDNRPKNLEVTDPSSHAKKHSIPAVIVKLKCAECLKVFSRYKCKVYKTSKRSFCSNSCTSTYYWRSRRAPHGASRYRSGCHCKICRAGHCAAVIAWRRKNGRVVNRQTRSPAKRL